MKYYAFDIETSSLTINPNTHRLTAVMERGGELKLMNWGDTQDWLNWIADYEAARLIGHNLIGFDLQFFEVDTTT